MNPSTDDWPDGQRRITACSRERTPCAWGSTPRIVRRRLSAGRWEELHRGVYRLAGAPASSQQALLAGCLSLGKSAVASHRAVGRLWRLAGVDEEVVEVSVTKGEARHRPGVVIHEVALPAVDVTTLDAIPATPPTRTLLDLAAVVPKDIVEAALDDALRRGLTSIARLRWRMTELGRRPGITVVRALLDARTEQPGVPQSVLETRLLRLLKRAGLPTPTCQHQVRERGRLIAVVDFAYPEAHVAIEVDPHDGHVVNSGFANSHRCFGHHIRHRPTSRTGSRSPRRTSR